MGESSAEIRPGSICSVPLATAGFDDSLLRARDFFPERTLQEVLAEISTHQYPRKELCAILDATAQQLSAPEESRRNIRALAENNCFVVVAGQQAGFLGGPLYTLYKALSAISLARRYERESGAKARFIPVFWVAGDDHDLAEINHAYGIGPQFDLIKLELPSGPEDMGRDASSVRLPFGQFGTVTKLFRRELASVVSKEFAQEIEELYAAQSLETAFAQLLVNWLGSQGLVVALSSSLRTLGTPLLQRNLSDFESVERMIVATGERMKTQGFKPGFSGTLVAPHFFHHEPDGKRQRVEPNQYTAEDIAASPRQFSAGAALRPIVQQTLFPVAAAVLGPGEIRYWAQLRDVHAHYGAPWPLIVPRLSLTVLDEVCEKAVRKLKIKNEPAALFRSEADWNTRLIAGSELAHKIDAHGTATLQDFEKLVGELPARTALGLNKMIDRTRASLKHRFNRLARRAALEIDTASDAAARHVDVLRRHVLPKNEPQERVLCCAQFMSACPQLPDLILEQIDPLAAVHHILTLS